MGLNQSLHPPAAIDYSWLYNRCLPVSLWPKCGLSSKKRAENIIVGIQEKIVSLVKPEHIQKVSKIENEVEEIFEGYYGICYSDTIFVFYWMQKSVYLLTHHFIMRVFNLNSGIRNMQLESQMLAVQDCPHLLNSENSLFGLPLI